MSNRLVQFGQEGPPGPPGTIELPEGRGLLGHNANALFSVPIVPPHSDAWYRQMLRLQANGSVLWERTPTLPMPGTDDPNGQGDPSITKEDAHGLALFFDQSKGYVLRDIVSPLDGLSDGLMLIDDGDPAILSYIGALDNSVLRVLGGAVSFARMWNFDGIPWLNSDGTASKIVSIYPGLGSMLIINDDGTLRYRKLGNGLREQLDEIQIDPSVVATLSGGKHVVGQARGRTMNFSGALKNSTSVSVNTNPTYVSLATIALGARSVGDIIKAAFQCNASGAGSQHVLRIRVTNSAAPDLAASAGASVRYETNDLFEIVSGGAHFIQVRHEAAVAESLWVHVIARMGTGPSWSVTDKELFAEVYAQ